MHADAIPILFKLVAFIFRNLSLRIIFNYEIIKHCSIVSLLYCFLEKLFIRGGND